MWDDRFFFVIASMAAAAVSISMRQRSLRMRSVLVASVIVVTVAFIGIRVWLYRPNSLPNVESVIPNVGGFIAILIGAVLGSFAAKFVSSLFDSEFQRRDPLIGAAALALLSIAYSLPLYSDAISDMLSSLGLSTVKTPFLELTLRERGTKSFTAATARSQSAAGQIPTPGDPKPGLKWLNEDTSDEKKETLARDKEYIDFAHRSLLEDYEQYKNATVNIKKFLNPAQVLSGCLYKYVGVLPDSALLLVDIKPVIESLFMLHLKAKQDSKNNKWNTNIDKGKPVHFWSKVYDVLSEVKLKFDSKKYPDQLVDWPAHSKECDLSKISKITTESITVDYLQPYSTLVLADLLIARGSKDEAISVLAEWLTLSALYLDTHEARHTLEWFELRVASRIILLMADVAGQNNLAYRDFFNDYKEKLEHYFSLRASLAQLPAKCKIWSDQAKSKKGSTSEQDNVEQLVFFQLLANEDESLRTEINFVGEESKFEVLEELNRRANFLTSIGGECLPENFEPNLRKGTIAEHRVTAGLVGLTVAERMATVASSRGDRNRAADIAREAEIALRAGYADLTDLVKQDRNVYRTSRNWSDRVFFGSRWEKSANLAARAFVQLQSKE